MTHVSAVQTAVLLLLAMKVARSLSETAPAVHHYLLDRGAQQRLDLASLLGLQPVNGPGLYVDAHAPPAPLQMLCSGRFLRGPTARMVKAFHF
jgi:hypothetical protein